MRRCTVRAFDAYLTRIRLPGGGTIAEVHRAHAPGGETREVAQINAYAAVIPDVDPYSGPLQGEGGAVGSAPLFEPTAPPLG